MANLLSSTEDFKTAEKDSNCLSIEQLRCQGEQALRGMLEIPKMEAFTGVSALRAQRKRVIFRPTAG